MGKRSDLSGGKNNNGPQHRIAELQEEVEDRDQVIDNLTIGKRNFWQGDIAEIILYGRDLSTNER